jgi:hypothetical protein
MAQLRSAAGHSRVDAELDGRQNARVAAVQRTRPYPTRPHRDRPFALATASVGGEPTPEIRHRRSIRRDGQAAALRLRAVASIRTRTFALAQLATTGFAKISRPCDGPIACGSPEPRAGRPCGPGSARGGAHHDRPWTLGTRPPGP